MLLLDDRRIHLVPYLVSGGGLNMLNQLLRLRLLVLHELLLLLLTTHSDGSGVVAGNTFYHACQIVLTAGTKGNERRRCYHVHFGQLLLLLRLKRRLWRLLLLELLLLKLSIVVFQLDARQKLIALPNRGVAYARFCLYHTVAYTVLNL